MFVVSYFILAIILEIVFCSVLFVFFGILSLVYIFITRSKIKSRSIFRFIVNCCLVSTVNLNYEYRHSTKVVFYPTITAGLIFFIEIFYMSVHITTITKFIIALWLVFDLDLRKSLNRFAYRYARVDIVPLTKNITTEILMAINIASYCMIEYIPINLYGNSISRIYMLFIGYSILFSSLVILYCLWVFYIGQKRHFSIKKFKKLEELLIYN
jgi:hypothetical protein